MHRPIAKILTIDMTTLNMFNVKMHCVCTTRSVLLGPYTTLAVKSSVRLLDEHANSHILLQPVKTLTQTLLAKNNNYIITIILLQ